MPYVANGAIQNEKPLPERAKAFFMTILNLIVLFFQTIFTSSPIATHLQQYKSSLKPNYGSSNGGGGGGGGYPGGGGGGGPNIRGVCKPSQYGGSAGG